MTRQQQSLFVCLFLVKLGVSSAGAPIELGARKGSVAPAARLTGATGFAFSLLDGNSLRIGSFLRLLLRFRIIIVVILKSRLMVETENKGAKQDGRHAGLAHDECWAIWAASLS